KRKINDSNCTFMFDSTVSKIDMEEGQIVITHSRDPLKSEVVKFKDLVIAEGGKRNTSKLLEEYIQYQPIPERPEEKHIMAYLTVETKDGQPKPIPMNKSFAHLVHEDYHGSIYCETYNKSASKIKL